MEAGEEAIVRGDAGQLRLVLANLLGNALVHTPARTPVEVTVRHTGSEVELEVRDHGPGLPTGQPEELFERFWRARGERAEPDGAEPRRGGAGLGLAIVAGIVAAHGGTVRASTAMGGGASFVVTWPLAALSAARPAPR